MLEAVPELFLLVPAVIGVGCVAATVFVIFWLGFGKQRTFEEAKAMASRHADKLLQEEAKNSPRPKKGKRSFPRKKKTDQWEDSQQEELSLESQTPKGILKPAPDSRKEPTPERSPRNRVGFNIAIDSEEIKETRTNPPTPHPSKTAPPVFTKKEMTRTPQPLFEEPEEEEEVPPPSRPPAEPSKPPAVETSKKTETLKSAPAQKRKPKAKKESGEPTATSDDGLPAGRIAEIVGVSPLSDDDIQQLMTVLLEKMNTNSEWEAANLRTESVKSLKKQNQDLHKRCEEAEKTVHSHYTKIKELRAEIQNEKMKHSATDSKLQTKITAHSNEMSIVKTRLAGVEEENKQLKARSVNVSIQKLEEENSQLKAQVHQMSGQTQSLSSQIKDMAEENAALKAELHRAKDAFKAGGQPRGGDRVTELESLLGNMEQEKEQLQSTMQMINDENSRLKGEAGSMKSRLTELDQLRTKTDKLEATSISLAGEKAALLREIDSLRTEKAAVQQAGNTETLNAQYEDKMAQEMASVRGELGSQVEGLQGRVTELEGRCGDKEREVEELTTQIQKCSSLQDELKAVSAQLNGEQTAKKELELELESLKKVATNGTSSDQPDSANEEELTHLKEEKEELKASVKEMEEKLINMKDKNNSLRETLWKAKDDSAAETKQWETKLKEAYQKAETLVKAAKKETLSEAQESQKSFLTQLFPTICVEEEQFSEWLDLFEVKVQTMQADKDQEIKALKSKKAELQENEQKSIQEAENFRQTLQATMGILEKLQSEVEGRNAEHQNVLQEKEEMINRERSTNRGLQDELRREKEASESLRADLEAARETGDEEARLEEVEGRLKESEHQHELSKQEVESLRHSLKHELEMKDKVQEELEQLQEKQEEIDKRLCDNQEEKEKCQQQVKELQCEVEKLEAQLKAANDQIALVKTDAPLAEGVQTEV